MSRCWWVALAAAVFGGVQLPAQAQCSVAAGCTPGTAPAVNRAYGMGLYRVELADLVDTTAAGAGYRDYSCRPGARLSRGTTYTLQVTTNAQADETVRAWLDLNGDGVFTVGELVLASTGRRHRSNFVVPGTVPAGAVLRLRIAADYVNAPVPGPCTTPQYSQTADYSVVVASGAPLSPRAAFAAGDSVSCSGTVAFRDRSANAPTAWRWSFGDGTASTAANPVHTYAAPGTYTVRLRTCNAAGCDSLTKPACVTVRGDGPRPIVCRPATQAYCCDFGLARVRGAGLDHRPGGGAAGYRDASCAQRVVLMADWSDTLRLTTGGVSAHDVRVYADLNDDGQFDPVAELLYAGQGVISPAVPLRIGSLTPGLVYNKALRLRLWADYAGSAGAGPCAAPEKGQVVDYALVVQPNTRAPRAVFTLTYAQVCGPVRVAVANASQGNATVRWDFGDGTASSAPAPPLHTYAYPGTYTLRLVVATGARTDTTRRAVVVATACPAYCTPTGIGNGYSTDYPIFYTRVQGPGFDNQETRPFNTGYNDYTRYYSIVHQGDLVTVRAQTLPSADGPIPWLQTVAWADFNQDGRFGPSEVVGNTGLVLGTHLITFRVPLRARLGATRLRLHLRTYQMALYTNGCPEDLGGENTEDYTLVVLPAPAPPRAGFAADLAASCSGQVQFTDTTGATPTSWHWDFGDGTRSTTANPLHAYATPGTYAVALRVGNAYGTDSVRRPAYVTVSGVGQGPRPATGPLLIPGTVCCDYGMAEARLAGLVYPVGPNQPGYRDETCRQPALRLTAGNTYPLVVQRMPRFCYNFVYLWLDANDDGRLTPDELLQASTSSDINQSPYATTFTVPVTAVRNRPLRLRLYWHGLYFSKSDPPVPDPSFRDEQYDQIRDFTVWVGGGALAAAIPAVAATWALYPNPTKGLVTLTGLHGPQRLEIRNVVGQLLFTQVLVADAQGNAVADCSALSKGLYLVRLSSASPVRRLVLQ